MWNGSYAAWGTNANQLIVVDTDVGSGGKEVPVYQIEPESGLANEITPVNAGAVVVFEGLDVSANGVVTFTSQDGLHFVDIDTRESIGEILTGNVVFSPSWSPDGQVLAYVEQVPVDNTMTDWNYPVRLLSLTEGCHGESLDIGYPVRSIDWSPDGRQLAFSTFQPGKIYFLDLTASESEGLLKLYQSICDHIDLETQEPAREPGNE